MDGRKVVYTDWEGVRCPKFVHGFSEEIVIKCMKGYLENWEKVYLIVSILDDTFEQYKVKPYISVWKRGGVYVGDHEDMEFRDIQELIDQDS